MYIASVTSPWKDTFCYEKLSGKITVSDRIILCLLTKHEQGDMALEWKWNDITFYITCDIQWNGAWRREISSEEFQTSKQQPLVTFSSANLSQLRTYTWLFIKKFLRNAILASGVLKGKMELVVSIQHPETFDLYGAWTLLCATFTIDVHNHVFLQPVYVFLSNVAFSTVRYDPRNL